MHQDVIINAQIFKHPTPIGLFLPEQYNDQTPIILFIPGLHSTINNCKLLLLNDFYQDKILCSYDRLKEGMNKNRATRNTNKYVKELHGVVMTLKHQYPNNKIYLLAESIGTSISLMFCYKYPNLVEHILCYNMPNKIIDTAHYSLPIKLLFGLEMIPVILFGITTYHHHPKDAIEQLTSNAIVIRMRKLNAPKRENNKNSWVSYLLFSRAWKTFKKMQKSKINYPYTYIQSGNDTMCYRPYFKKFMDKYQNDKIICWDHGMHMISLEPEVDELYKIFTNIIYKKNE